MIYWRWPLVIQPAILANTDDKADYHIREEYQLRLTNSLTSLPHTAIIEDNKLYVLTGRRSQIDI